MGRDTFILVAFCIFALLLGMRMKQRFAEWKNKKENFRVNKNQRSKLANANEPPLVRERRLRHEQRVRFFTIAQLFVVGGLMVYMIPALVRDFMVPGQVDMMNIILRCLIFVFTIYIFIIGYIKAFNRRNKENTEN